MVAFWRSQPTKTEREEIAEFERWIAEVKEPIMDNHRLEAEIRAKRNEIINALGQRYVRPRINKITQIRRDIDTLKGMVFAWLYISGKYDKVPALSEVTDEVNDLAMLWLSVDLAKMLAQAYPQKAPRDI